MPQFSDDLFLGAAKSFVGTNSNSNFGNPSPMDLGFGPMGRSYIYDIVPATNTTGAVLTAQTPTGATTYSGASLAATSATAGTTNLIRTDGVQVIQLDYPRAVSVTTGAGSPTSANITVSGYDYYNQPMTEVIQSGTVASTTTNGRKAFFQISSVAFSGGTTVTVSVDTTKIFGFPCRIADIGYVINVGWDNALAEDTGTAVVGLDGAYYGPNQVISAITAASPGVITVPYSPPSGTLVQFTGSFATLTGISTGVTYVWTNVSSTTGKVSTTQANYLAGTFVNTSGSYTASGASLVTLNTSSATTPDVRGTYAPSSAPNGLKRLVINLGLTGVQVGPNSTRVGLLGADQA